MAATNAPKSQATRRRANVPERGDWKAADGVGWQHGEVPAPPEGLMSASVEAWRVWMAAWFAAHWTPDDLPGLRSLVLLYDQVQRGEYQRHGELRLMMDTYGVTPKGQQDRRWARPPVDGESPAAGVRQVRPRKLKAV